MIYDKDSSVYTVMIGIPPTFVYDELFKDKRGKLLDACIMHEPEYAIKDFIQNINNNKDWKLTNGIAYLSKNKIVITGNQPPVDINTLPIPDISELHLENYTMPFSREKVALIETSRGCNYKCTYCIGRCYYSGGSRYKTPKLIVDEIEDIVNKYDVTTFLFWADSWMGGKKVAEQTCDLIIKRGLKIKFLCNGRVDGVYPELLSKMKAAGCELIAYGVESLNQDILNNVKKGVTVKTIQEAIRLTNEAGIPCVAHMIMGLPGETWETVKETTKLIIKANPTYINVYSPVPYKGTELYDLALKNNWINSKDLDKYEILNAVMRNENMTTEEINKARTYIMGKFFFRPRVISRELWKALTDKHPINSVINLFKDGFNFMSKWVYDGKVEK